MVMSAVMKPRLLQYLCLPLALGLAQCASYHAAPLPTAPDLRAGVSGLRTRLPDGTALDAVSYTHLTLPTKRIV